MKTNSNYMVPEVMEITMESGDILCMSAQDVTVTEGWEWDNIV